MVKSKITPTHRAYLMSSVSPHALLSRTTHMEQGVNTLAAGFDGKIVVTRHG